MGCSFIFIFFFFIYKTKRKHKKNKNKQKNRVVVMEAVARVVKNELNQKLREKVRELKIPLEVCNKITVMVVINLNMVI